MIHCIYWKLPFVKDLNFNFNHTILWEKYCDCCSLTQSLGIAYFLFGKIKLYQLNLFAIHKQSFFLYRREFLRKTDYTYFPNDKSFVITHFTRDVSAKYNRQQLSRHCWLAYPFDKFWSTFTTWHKKSRHWWMYDSLCIVYLMLAKYCFLSAWTLDTAPSYWQYAF